MSAAKTKPNFESSMDFDAIVDDLAALRRDFATMMGNMKSSAVEGANGAAENAFDRLGDQVNHLYDRVKAQGERSANMIHKKVEEQPVMSLLIAFGVGFIASRLLNR
jgi:ElaB/YqjD/DUF883 family membrane-anchored ribosome-binding protein